MWSAITVAMLCMIVNWSERSWAAALKRADSCRTQESFHPDLRPDLSLNWAEFKTGRTDFSPERADFRSERTFFV